MRDKGIARRGIAKARHLGNCGSALITFDGTSLPFRVGLGSFTVRVHPFRRQTQVCDTCHRIRHRSAQFPNSTQARSSTFGAPKHGVDACPSALPKCRNCGGAHLATARSCPKVQEIQTAMAQRDRGRTQRRQSPSSTSKEGSKDTISGDSKNLQKVVREMVGCMFSKQVQEQFSLLGYQGKSKFKDAMMCKVVIGAIQSRAQGCSVDVMEKQLAGRGNRVKKTDTPLVAPTAFDDEGHSG
ncbi:hypothetical protein HPB47_024464 [Ixodes persulcatus]|uniref:Uncharacterized protein n=1 Tax=Ixodes persulcatus TaxID=34615 RepID=A0AC60R0D8_IXOPE|nr:hypothetical protein HPB47_024464 [Ixodes persulcatus]